MLKLTTLPQKVFRVSKGDPWKIWPPHFQNRFDISAEDEPTATLYTGESSEAAVAEILAPLRPDLSTIAEVNKIQADDILPASAVVSSAWLSHRNIGQALVRQGSSIVDLTDAETINELRNTPDIANKANECGFNDVDESSLKASGFKGRRFTQTVAAYIYNKFFSGVRYGSRLGAQYHCIAAFIPLSLKSAANSEFITEVLDSHPLKATDECVQSVIKIFGLKIIN